MDDILFIGAFILIIIFAASIGIWIAKNTKKQREEMLERINTKQGILLRINRSIQVEGAFGVLKEDMGFRRFLTRGTANVRTEILLLCLAYNVQKLHNKTVANRQGQFLHEIKVA